MAGAAEATATVEATAEVARRAGAVGGVAAEDGPAEEPTAVVVAAAEEASGALAVGWAVAARAVAEVAAATAATCPRTQ